MERQLNRLDGLDRPTDQINQTTMLIPGLKERGVLLENLKVSGGGKEKGFYLGQCRWTPVAEQDSTHSSDKLEMLQCKT